MSNHMAGAEARAALPHLDAARAAVARLAEPEQPDSALKSLYRRCAEDLPETLANLSREKITGVAREANAVGDALYGPRAVGNSYRHPLQSLAYGVHGPLVRADIAGSTTAGGFLIDTLNLGAAQSLLSLMVFGRLGVTGVNPARHNISYPKVTASATTYWLSTESTQLTESEQQFGQLALSPHTVGGYTEISRPLLLQSDAPAVVARDLGRKTGRTIQAAAFSGSGSGGQIHGVFGTGGTNTTSGTSFSLSTATTAAADVGDALEDGANPGWVTDKATAFLLRARQELTNSTRTLWTGPQTFGELADYPAAATSGMPSASAIFGCWAYAALAVWGGMTIEVNPYAAFTSGIIGMRCLITCDFGLLWPSGFTTVSSIT
jgi:HK97 family phage major capsid protein